MDFIDFMDSMDSMDFMESNSSFYDYEHNYRYYETNELIKTIFICGGVFITGGVSALMIISRLLVNSLEKEFKLLYGYDSDDEEFFDSKYLKEYNELEDTAIDSSEISTNSNKIIKEKTPDGLVYLGYDSKKEAFFYYSDFKDVAYNYLEVCARKFVIEHNCKALLLNTKDEIIKAFKSFTNNVEGSNDSIFAKLKTEDVNKKESIDHKLKIKTKQLPVPENANKFVYKGKLNSYSTYSTYTTSSTSTSSPEFIEMDYKTFKLSQTTQTK